MTKRLCKLNRRDITSSLGEIHRLVAQPAFMCRSCARSSADKNALCKPEALPKMKSKGNAKLAPNVGSSRSKSAEKAALKLAKKTLKKQKKYQKKLAKVLKQQQKMMKKQQALQAKFNALNPSVVLPEAGIMAQMH
ncbi:hypothetical protein I2712_003922 [Vibrio fluvialis]|nr:hypothetical protein [Vibrio fluvialis]